MILPRKRRRKNTRRDTEKKNRRKYILATEFHGKRQKIRHGITRKKQKQRHGKNR
jgi:hypothetical protein